jgi:hypothetical protein
MEETIKRTMIKIVRLNITFSQPRFSGTLFIRLDLDSVSPLDWRKIKTERVSERII